MFGWLGLFAAQPAWYANLTGLVLCFAAILPARAALRGLVWLHLVLAACAFLPMSLPHNEAGADPVCLAGYGPGFFWWLGWVVLAALAAGLRVNRPLSPAG